MFRSVSAFMISPTMTANPFSSRASSSRRTAHCIPVSTMRRRRHSDAGSGKSRRAAAPGLACGATTRHEAGAGIRSAPSTASKRGETMRKGDRPAMVPLSMVTDGSPSSFFVMRTSARRPVRPAGQRLSPGFQDNAAPVPLDTGTIGRNRFARCVKWRFHRYASPGVERQAGADATPYWHSVGRCTVGRLVERDDKPTSNTTDKPGSSSQGTSMTAAAAQQPPGRPVFGSVHGTRAL